MNLIHPLRLIKPITPIITTKKTYISKKIKLELIKKSNLNLNISSTYHINKSYNYIIKINKTGKSIDFRKNGFFKYIIK